MQQRGGKTLTVQVVETSEARDRARRIRALMEKVWPLVIEAYRLRDWEALRYRSWEAYCQEEIGRPLRLEHSEQKEAHQQMSEAGMSTRAIATVTGVSYETVAQDTAGVRNLTPITGLDGKTYPRRTPRTGEEVADKEERHAFRKQQIGTLIVGVIDALKALDEFTASDIREAFASRHPRRVAAELQRLAARLVAVAEQMEGPDGNTN